MLYNSQVLCKKGSIAPMGSHKWKIFFSYYKWHLIFISLVLVCIVFVLTSITTSYDADLYIGYVNLQSGYMDTQKFNDNKGDIENLLKDATGDDFKYAAINAIPANKDKEAVKFLEEMIETESYHIYIAPMQTFLAHDNPENFATLLDPKGNVNTLSDSNGRIYAVSLEGNAYIETLGFRGSAALSGDSSLYIAAANFEDKELTDYEKNGINISNFIVENRKKG